MQVFLDGPYNFLNKNKNIIVRSCKICVQVSTGVPTSELLAYHI